MSQRSKARKIRAQIREHARMAELLLPPTPGNCPPYTRVYFESYKPKLFEACRNSRHRHCPKTAEHNSGRDHVYCICPCHSPKMSRHKRRQIWLKLKAESAKKERKVRTPSSTPRTIVGMKGQKKTFRYVKAPDGKIPAGIMFLVYAAIAEKKEGTVAEIATLAIEKGLAKITGQDPVNQTSVMLHRMLKTGVVEMI